MNWYFESWFGEENKSKGDILVVRWFWGRGVILGGGISVEGEEEGVCVFFSVSYGVEFFGVAKLFCRGVFFIVFIF